MPEVGIYDSPDVNAFATGPSRSRALVAASTGLLQSMRAREVQGVLGHEIAHVANGDMVTMTLVQGVINAVVLFLAHILAFVVSQALRSRDERDTGGGWIQYILVQVFQLVFSSSWDPLSRVGFPAIASIVPTREGLNWPDKTA